MRRVRFLASAREDIREQKAFYKIISPTLSYRFQSAVEFAVKEAAEQPLAMQVLNCHIRRWPLDGFPHGVLYRVEEECLLVLAIFHPSQMPEKWQSRART